MGWGTFYKVKVVYGRPNTDSFNCRTGEAPRAYIVLKPSVAASEAVAEKIHSFVASNAADFKRLSGGIEFLDAVPKAASGKILRKDLVAMYKSRGAGE